MLQEPIDLETFEQLDSEDYELDEGRLVELSRGKPLHGKVCLRLASALLDFVEANGLGEVYINDTGFVLSETPATVRGPDVAFVRAQRLAGSSPNEWLRGAPDLAVEVASPSNRPGQLQRKVGQYLDAGASLVWVVYPEEKKVVIYRADAAVQIVTDALDGEGVLPGFRLTLDHLFR